jgi:predicted thioesterase
VAVFCKWDAPFTSIRLIAVKVLAGISACVTWRRCWWLELTAIEGRKLTFQVDAWDEVEKIGEALHERFLIDMDKFVAKVRSKGK